jgi:tyrosine-protein kinase Etk/Wzc
VTGASRGRGGAGPVWEDPAWIRRTLILAFVFSVLTLVVSLLWPKSYKADATILPNPPAGSSSSLLGLAAASGFGDLLSGSLGAAENPVLTYPEILTSRGLLERVALAPYPMNSRNTVSTALEVEGMSRRSIDRATRLLTSITRVDANLRSGIIHISAVTKDSVLSAYIVQQMLSELDRFNLSSRSSQGHATRGFIEGRLSEARHELGEAEQVLAAFRKNNIRIGNSPQLLLEQGRLEREVDTRSELFRLLARQFEMARIEEMRDTPTFTVIDPARPPVRKYRPRTTFNVLLAFLFLVGSRLAWAQIFPRRKPRLAVAPQAAALG